MFKKKIDRINWLEDRIIQLENKNKILDSKVRLLESRVSSLYMAGDSWNERIETIEEKLRG